jgi:hypothetical protein
VAYRSITKNTITKTHVEGADPPKIPIGVSYRSRIKHARSCSRQAHSARYFLSRSYQVPVKHPPSTSSLRRISRWMNYLPTWTRSKKKSAPNATDTSRIHGWSTPGGNVICRVIVDSRSQSSSKPNPISENCRNDLGRTINDLPLIKRRRYRVHARALCY